MVRECSLRGNIWGMVIQSKGNVRQRFSKHPPTHHPHPLELTWLKKIAKVPFKVAKTKGSALLDAQSTSGKYKIILDWCIPLFPSSWALQHAVHVLCVSVVLCGRSIPPPVLSFGRVMVVQLMTDSSVSARGFSANLSAISEKGECVNRHKHAELVLILQPTTHFTHPHALHVLYILQTASWSNQSTSTGYFVLDWLEDFQASKKTPRNSDHGDDDI